MRTFNIDPLSHVLAEGQDEVVEAPNGARFSRTRGIYPICWRPFGLVAKSQRAAMIWHRMHKIIMNSFMGCWQRARVVLLVINWLERLQSLATTCCAGRETG